MSQSALTKVRRQPPLAGTYGVVANSPGFVGAGIRFFTRSPFSHAFLYLGNGEVIEAESNGAIISPIGKYLNNPNVAWNDEEPIDTLTRVSIVREGRKLKGTPYNDLDIVALMLAPEHIRIPLLDNYVANDKRLICSQLVDVAYMRAGYHLFQGELSRKPERVTPRDLGLRIALRSWESMPGHGAS